MLKFAVQFDAPCAIRYPRGEAYDGLSEYRQEIALGKAEVLFDEQEIALVAVGSMVKTAQTVREQLKEEGRSCTLVNARFVKPVDEEMIRELTKKHSLIVTLEENVACGGFGEHVKDVLSGYEHVKVLTIAIPDEYVEHGNVELLKKEIGLDVDSITAKIKECL